MTHRGVWCCDWPACDLLAARRFRTSVEHDVYVNLCNPHARVWSAMTLGERDQLDRKPSRMIPAGPRRALPALPLPPYALR